MPRRRVERFRFSSPQEARGTVKVWKSAYGLEVEVAHEGTRWSFLIDLFYLPGPVQVVCYNPKDQDGDPLQRVRVFPDGRLQMFEC